MILVDKKITTSELKPMAAKMHTKDMVKGVVDIEKGVMAIDAQMHADLEEWLLEEHGSKQINLWGINLHPYNSRDGLIVFDSMINIRPLDGNRSRGVEDPQLRAKITAIVNRLVTS